MNETSELDQLVATDTRPGYADGPQPGDEPPTDAEAFRADEAAEVAEAMFATHGEEG